MEQEKLRTTIRQIITEGFSEMFQKAVAEVRVKREDHYQSLEEKALEDKPEPQGVDKVFAKLNKKLR